MRLFQKDQFGDGRVLITRMSRRHEPLRLLIVMRDVRTRKPYAYPAWEASGKYQVCVLSGTLLCSRGTTAPDLNIPAGTKPVLISDIKTLHCWNSIEDCAPLIFMITHEEK